MAVTSESTTQWHGSLTDGSGTVTLASGSGSFPVTWASRSGAAADTTTPEELLGAAHSACFSMALSNGLAKAGSPPEALDTSAAVTFQPGEGITGIHLTVRAKIPGMSTHDFLEFAEDAKENCPVSMALTGTDITLDASLA